VSGYADDRNIDDLSRETEAILFSFHVERVAIGAGGKR